VLKTLSAITKKGRGIMSPIVPNKIDWQWYGETITSKRAGNCLKISKENPSHAKSIMASNDKIVKKSLSNIILKYDLETTPDAVLSSHGLTLKHPVDLYNKAWPIPDNLPGNWKNRTPEEMEMLRKAMSAIQGHEGVGYALNYAAKKDLNQLSLHYLEGGWTPDHDIKTILQSDGSNSFPTDYPSPAGLTIVARHPKTMEPFRDPGTSGSIGFNNDIMYGSPRSPFTLAIIEEVVKKYAMESDACFGKTSSGNSIYINQEKRIPKYASVEERNKNVIKTSIENSTSGIEADSRWKGTLESSGNALYRKIIEEYFNEASDAKNKPMLFGILPRSIITPQMGINDAKWSVIPIEKRVSHSIDNPLDVENNIILPLQSQVKPPPEIPYATDDIMELLEAKYSWNGS